MKQARISDGDGGHEEDGFYYDLLRLLTGRSPEGAQGALPGGAFLTRYDATTDNREKSIRETNSRRHS